jgi:hypothetical protein
MAEVSASADGSVFREYPRGTSGKRSKPPVAPKAQRWLRQVSAKTADIIIPLAFL